MQATRTVRTRTFMLVLILVAAILPIITAPPAHAAGPAVFVNEFHYDNSGTDSNETIEIKAKNFLIATGSKPRRPESIPFDAHKVFDSNEILG